MATARLANRPDADARLLESLTLVAESATAALRPVMRDQERAAAALTIAAESATAALRPVMLERRWGARARESRARRASSSGRGARGRPARRARRAPARRSSGHTDDDLGEEPAALRSAPWRGGAARAAERSSLEAPRPRRGASAGAPAVPALLDAYLGVGAGVRSALPFLRAARRRRASARPGPVLPKGAPAR